VLIVTYTYPQGRVKGKATGAIALGPSLQGGPRDDIYLFQIKYSVQLITIFSWKIVEI